MVGAAGFEPATLWSQTRCATRLRYAPIMATITVQEDIDPIRKNISQIKELDTSSKKKKIIENKKIGVLNIIIVFIISFVALIILVETFKKPISIYIPNIEFILNSLHEILRDIILFFKDLVK